MHPPPLRTAAGSPPLPRSQVPSNLSNQVDHLVALIAHRFDRLKGNGLDFAPALREAVEQVHDKLFETYFRWMAHVRLRARTTTRGSKVTKRSLRPRWADRPRPLVCARPPSASLHHPRGSAHTR